MSPSGHHLAIPAANDIQKNLERPLAEIREIAAERGVELVPIRTAVRTGDTPTYQRQKMLEKVPHILVTTPESLFILLTAKKSREALKTARTLIVDEIHAVAGYKDELKLRSRLGSVLLHHRSYS